MSEVKKWYIGVYGGDAQARPCSPAEFEIIHAGEGRYFVLAEDFDNAARLFLDAAERCVASERREKELQQRLTAADERVDVLEGLLKRARHRIANLSRAPVPFDDPLDGPVLHGIDDALCEHSYHHFGEYPRRRCNLCNKPEPAEGGGDEADQRRQDDESLQRRDDDDRRECFSDAD